MLWRIVRAAVAVAAVVGLGALARYELPRLGVASAMIGPTSQFEPYQPDRHSKNPIVEGALLQLENPSQYTPGYFRIPYPNGDLPSDQGVCTDVVIRALRHAGHDLQKLIHEDMGANFRRYPRREARPDANIDHRRVPNQMYFFSTHGKTLTKVVSAKTLREWQPGDLVYWKLDSGLDHAGVVSDRKNSDGIPLVIHNISQTAEQDVLTTWKIQGHYRYPAR